MIEFFIRQHKMMNLVLIGIIVIGAYYFVIGQKEGFPNIGLDQVYISTSYPGVSARDVDVLITSKIEDAIESVDGIKDIKSTSSQGQSTIIVSIDTVNSGVDLDTVASKIRDKIDLIKKDLPANLDSDPVVQTISFAEVMPIIQVFIAGDLDFNELKKIADQFSTRMGNVSGVSKTEKVNYPKTQVWVSIDPEKLEKYEIDISEVGNAVRAANLNMPSGTIKDNNEEIIIKTWNPLQNISDIESIIIRGNDNFQSIRIKGLARTEVTSETLREVIESDGKAGIGVSVFKSLNGDVIEVADATKDLIKEFQELYPDLTIFHIQDISFYVKRRLNVLGNNATIGLLLVFLCLIIFFEFRVTFWTTLGIPVSLCFALIACYQLGITLNLMSMFGFIIVLGMLVDDAIIVSENIYQKYEKGMPLMEAAISGAQEMLIPILAIVATTMASFLPLMTLPDIFGKVLGIIPQVVVLAMIASFLESLLILPGHIAHMKDRNIGRKERQNELQKQFIESPYNISNETVPDFSNVAALPVHGRLGQKQKKPPQEKRQWFNKLRNFYINLITRLTLRPVLSATFILLLSIAILLGFGSQLRFVFFPGEAEDIILNIKLDKKSPIEKTQVALRKLERQLRIQLGNDVREYFSTAGATQEVDHANKLTRSYVGNVYMNIYPSEERKYSVGEITKIMEDTAATIPEVKEAYVVALAGGPPAGNPVEVEMFFDSIESMGKAKLMADKMKEFISGIPNTTSETVSYEEGKEEIILMPNIDRAIVYGVNLDKIGTIVGSSFRDFPATTINDFAGVDGEVEVVVKLDEEKVSQSTVTNLMIKSLFGKNLGLNNFVTANTIVGEGRITKENGRYTLKVAAQLEDTEAREYTGQKINQEIKEKIPEWEKEFPEADFRLGGEQEEQQKLMFGGIRAFLLSLFGVLLVLVTIFRSYLQPFIIMSVLPFITVGATIGLFINDVPIGLMPLLGMVALTGVVVNDSIVMVNLINKKRLHDHHRPLREIVIESAGQRLRAILMTTITTIVGLIPIAYGIGGEEPFIAPMAITFLWGMVFSSLMILLLIPNFYLIIDKIRHFPSRFRKS